MLNFIYMIPKLWVCMREEVLCAKGSSPQACAQGYNHTYFVNQDLDLQALALLPTDEQINAAATSASKEAIFLVSLLGVNTFQLYNLVLSLTKSLIPMPLTPHHDNPHSKSIADDPLLEHDSITKSAYKDEHPGLSDVEELQAILQQLEPSEQEMPLELQCPTFSHKTEQRLEQLSYAAAAITIQEMAEVYVFINI
jgi:hypothetical protein